ncbi:MAG TPA: methyltransferase domain-containing protein [Candidatus Binataceae bacterium]|nr:methyltransferase domain-containing protein [Candidatus Binataceae bacterium]
MERTKLNLGCGKKKIDDAVNVDIASSVGADITHDLNERPWPLPDSQFSEVFAYDVIEHCDDIIATMEEIHRVSTDGAVVHITVPHFSCSNAFADPTHKHYFAQSSFHYVTGEHEFSFYTSSRFRRVASSIIFAPTLVNKLVHRLANRFPEGYERRWAWIFPAWFLYFELEVVKNQK